MRLPGIHLRHTRINDRLQGAGVGVWIYRQLIDWADRQGLPVYSDFAISAKAQPIYAALARRGYNVEQINAVSPPGDEGFIRGARNQPIYRISRTGVESEYDHASPPRDDYQIDAPEGLRDRLARIEAKNALASAESQYNKLSPIDQAMVDMGEFMLRTADGERSARAMLADAERAQAKAKAMQQGFDAAVRCAIRHGAGAVVSGGAIGSEIMVGQALGAAAALPASIGFGAFQGMANQEVAARQQEAASAALDFVEGRRATDPWVMRPDPQTGVDALYDPTWDALDQARRYRTAGGPEGRSSSERGDYMGRPPTPEEAAQFPEGYGLEPAAAPEVQAPSPEDEERMVTLFRQFLSTMRDAEQRP